MAFVRVKKINGNSYAYLVENSWTSKGTRQKVGKYLGKIYAPAKVKSESFCSFLSVSDLGKHIRENDFKAIATNLIQLELHNHDVKSEFTVNFTEGSVKNTSGKEVVVAMNNGFLCSHTLKNLVGYKPEQDYSGYKLADLITGAGIIPEQDVFIELYGKFKSKHEAAAAKKFEFYY